MQTKLSDNVKSSNVAEELAKQQKEVSISEFFLKNRHLLGFDNPKKALLTTIKEAVDNSLDACGENRVLPDIIVTVENKSENKYKVVIEDNGPGITKEQMPKVFGKLLYGSKFHRLRQSRGIQGIGISAAVMYAQLTTGKPAKILSKIGKGKPAHYIELHLNTKTNSPEIIRNEEREWEKDHGTIVEVELEADYQKGQRSVDEFLKYTAIANPHAHIIYNSPDLQKTEFLRATNELPKDPKEIKPHPYGVELGILISMLRDTKANTLSSFLQTEFSRVSPGVSKEIIEKAKLYDKAKPERIAREEAESLLKAIKETKIIAPPTDCLVPIGKDSIVKGLKKEVEAEFYTSITRPPAVYRGFPFQIEAGIAYGGALPTEDLARVIRFANRVPLQYQQSACAVTKAAIETAWKNYGISQSRGALPSGPLIIMVHIASVWVPFTSESKEAVASYPEIMHEIKLALQECGRELASYVRKVKKTAHEAQRKKIFELYIIEVADSLHDLVKCDKKKVIEDLKKVSQSKTLSIEEEEGIKAREELTKKRVKSGEEDERIE